jgi:hypothetical protein
MAIEITAGDKATYFIFMKDKNGDAIDLTNITEIKLGWKKDLSLTDTVLFKSGPGTAPPLTIDSPATDGKIIVELEPADTDITPECYGQTIQIIDAEGPLTAILDEDNLPITIKPKPFA